MIDLTVAAIPGYFGTMGAEYRWLRRRAEQQGPTPVDYEPRDTVTSLAMGVGSLLAPLVMPKLLGRITPGKSRAGTALLATAAGAVVVTTIADRLARLEPAGGEPGSGLTGPAGPEATLAPASRRERRRRTALMAKRVASVGGVASIVAGGIAATSTWASRTTTEAMWKRRILPDLGGGPLALAAAVLGWDFLYYWNHRFEHTSRYMWAIHVVHHSSEHYNLSTALRQPVAEAFGTYLPTGFLALAGIRPELVEQARGINLLYQYWIHTDAIRRLGRLERFFNTPSHHRVHHGSNRQYLDRNHGSMLIVWDRLFGTFEEEREPVVYGLTKNIETFNPIRVATHEHADLLHDVAQSTTWPERLSFVLRGPGWAYRRHAERDQRADGGPAPRAALAAS